MYKRIVMVLCIMTIGALEGQSTTYYPGVPLGIPGKSWAIVVPGVLEWKAYRDVKSDNFIVEEYIQRLRLVVSVVVSTSSNDSDSAGYRDKYFAIMRQKYGPDFTAYRSMQPPFAAMEWAVKEDNNKLTVYKILFLVRDGVRFNILFKVLHDSDAKSSEICKGTQVSENWTPDRRVLYLYANWLYFGKRYRDSIPVYEAALALERTGRWLPRDKWIILVDNLAMAYGMTGKLEECRRILEYGLSVEPKYALFLYNMACYWGEIGDRSRTMEYLQATYKHRKTIGTEGRFPNVRKDSSFRKFKNDPGFQSLLDTLERQRLGR